jgi:hypothetical protein
MVIRSRLVKPQEDLLPYLWEQTLRNAPEQQHIHLPQHEAPQTTRHIASLSLPSGKRWG